MNKQSHALGRVSHSAGHDATCTNGTVAHVQEFLHGLPTLQHGVNLYVVPDGQIGHGQQHPARHGDRQVRDRCVPDPRQ